MILKILDLPLIAEIAYGCKLYSLAPKSLPTITSLST